MKQGLTDCIFQHDGGAQGWAVCLAPLGCRAQAVPGSTLCDHSLTFPDGNQSTNQAKGQETAILPYIQFTVPVPELSEVSQQCI